MKLLLDTHTFLWFIEDNSQLSGDARSLLESDADLLLSTASLWEIAIKNGLGKIVLAQPFAEFIPTQLAENEIALLAITINHLAAIPGLPMHHRDPFDRLLIAQAITENLPIVSLDGKFDAYGIERLW